MKKFKILGVLEDTLGTLLGLPDFFLGTSDSELTVFSLFSSELEMNLAEIKPEWVPGRNIFVLEVEIC